MSKSLVKRSKILKRELLKRINELELTWTDIAIDAQKRGMKISISTLSKYFNDSIATNLSDEGIEFLCLRYGVNISLFIGDPLTDKPIDFEILPYDEKKCLKALKKHFQEHE